MALPNSVLEHYILGRKLLKKTGSSTIQRDLFKKGKLIYSR